tara:strand:+ start:985 stop:1239 length:255 start_codon:yes stop_codon:yes gene_type:complete
MEHHCHCCDKFTEVHNKIIAFYCTPRQKDIDKGLFNGPFWTDLTIHICDNCSNILIANNIHYTQGWDNWDAIDTLQGMIMIEYH